MNFLVYSAVTLVLPLCTSLGSVGADADNSGIEQGTVETSTKACHNFYKHVCDHRGKKFSETSPRALKTQLYKKVKDILDKVETENNQRNVPENDQVDSQVHIARMAKKLYSACLSDQEKSSRDKVRTSVNTMLASLGIKNWPLGKTSEDPTETYAQILERTGLRPFATIMPVPDRTDPWYILALNGPFPRFGAYPEAMMKLNTHHKRYNAYRRLIHSVLSLYSEDEVDAVMPADTTEEENTYYAYSVEEGDGSSQYSTEKEEDISDPTGVISDILEVEIQIANMMYSARYSDVYETHTAQDWQKRLGEEFPFMAALGTDFTKARRTLANNYIIGLHLQNYFKALAEYLKTLNVRKLMNYLGWFFVREVADVLTLDVRNRLDQFLRTISKAGVAKVLNEESCIEKLIGYHPLMEKGIAHLYLQKYFEEKAINKADIVAKHLNTSFYQIILRNTWMDEDTRKTMTDWIKELEYLMGAPTNLLNAEYIKKEYELVNPLEEDSLIMQVFAFRENNFFQSIRLNKEEYDRRKIWPSSTLRTDGRYSGHYTSLEMPAGALQDSIFRFYGPGTFLFGSMGTLTAEKLSDSFIEEGQGWPAFKGKYLWTEDSKKEFNKRRQCLRKKVDQQPSPEEKRKMDPLERFERKGGDSIMPLKLRDHIGLRTSFEALRAIVSECSNSYSAFGEDNGKKMARDFFHFYALRHCESSDPDEEHRVNFALKKYKEFSCAFSCIDGDRMKGEDNCQIVIGKDTAEAPSGLQ